MAVRQASRAEGLPAERRRPLERGLGLRVVDVHTYVMPAMEVVYDVSSPTLRSRWGRIEPLLALTQPTPDVGDWESSYLRIPGYGVSVDTERPTPAPLPRRAEGTRTELEPGVLHDNPRGRLRAMDRLGASVQVVAPALPLDVDWALGSDVTRTILAAYNDYVMGYCSAASDRLRAVIQVHGAEPHWSAQQLEDVAGSDCVAAVTAQLPARIAPDSRNFEPIWRALDEAGLPLLHRPAAGTEAWRPDRLVSYLALSGILDRHPTLTLVLAGWPAGWLADWCERHLASGADNDFLRYVEEGRVYVGIDPLETAADVKRVIDATGDRWLLWQSHFPFGVESVLDSLPEAARERILSGNAAACGVA